MDKDGTNDRLLEWSRGLLLTSLAVKRGKSQLIHLKVKQVEFTIG